MTTYFKFVPNVQSPFTFQPTLDRQQFSAKVAWNLFGQRWYLTVSQLTGAPVFTVPLLGSPDGAAVESATWAVGIVTAVTSKPHGYTTGETVSITVSGFAPSAYNGTVLAFIVDAVTFTYPITGNPGAVTQLGSQIYDLNLAAGYFTDSTLVFRESNQTFEVIP